MKKSIGILEKLYFSLLCVLFFFIVGTTHIIRGDINFRNIIIDEEYIESFLIIILFLFGYIVIILYRKEIRTREKLIAEEKERTKDIEVKLNDAFMHLGRVNVQMQEIRDALSGLEKFPESKNDYKNILVFLCEKTLGIVNSDWVLFRLVDVNSLKILREKSLARGETLLLKYKINNSDLTADRQISGYNVITSKQSNLGIKAYFIFPIKKLTREQKAMIQAIAQELEMIFIIYNSKYYKKQK